MMLFNNEDQKADRAERENYMSAVSQSCRAPQWPALPTTSVIAFLGTNTHMYTHAHIHTVQTHIVVTSGSIAQLNVFSLSLLRGLCRASLCWADLRPVAPSQLPGHIQHCSHRNKNDKTGRKQGEWWIDRKKKERTNWDQLKMQTPLRSHSRSIRHFHSKLK